MTQPCPPAATLSAWLDDELSDGESQGIRAHMKQCATCREQVLGWYSATPLSSPLAKGRPEGGRAEASAGCLDEETLVAYSDAELSAAEAAPIEQHLLKCVRCVTEVQRLMKLRVLVGEAPARVGAGERLTGAAAGAAHGWWSRLRGSLQSIGELVVQPIPLLSAVTVVALAIIVITRFVPLGGDVNGVRFRGGPGPQRVEVVVDQAPGHTRPGDVEPVVVTLRRGTIAIQLEQSAEWTRVELADGRRVWMRSAMLSTPQGHAP